MRSYKLRDSASIAWSQRAGRRLDRRAFMQGTAFLATATLAGALAGRTRAQEKMSQEQAQYQDSPKDGQKCAGCRHFIQTEGACRLVEGSISPNGWCTLWTASA